MTYITLSTCKPSFSYANKNKKVFSSSYSMSRVKPHLVWIMTMALTSLFCFTRFIPTSFVTSTRNTPSPQTCASYNPHKQCKREFPLPAVASVPYQPIKFDYLQEEFSGHGVTFEGVGDNCIAKMELKNGSTVTMMLPSGLITSYKAPMWHGGKLELLHTSVSEGEYGDALIQGGVSLNFNFQTDDGELSWSPSNWVLHKIEGNSQESIKVCFSMCNSNRFLSLIFIQC